jgi:hypothetical protein
LSSGEYRGSVEQPAELEVSGQLRGTGTADGAFHEPASPVREGATSEGWSGSGTFSGAGPGTVSGSDSSSNLTPPVTESSSNFKTEVSGNAALENRDEDLSERGLEPDSNALNREEAFSNRVEGDMDEDQVLIFEDWTIVEPDTSVGGPAGSDSGSATSSNSFNSEGSGDTYSHELHQRVQRDWSSRLGNTDVPATSGIQPMEPRVMDHEFDHLRIYNSETQSNVGGAAGAEAGGKSSHDKECEDKGKGSAAESESGASTSAPGEYGDRARSSNYDDGHLSGNNAKGNESLENSTPPSNESTSPSEDGALTQPDL